MSTVSFIARMVMYIPSIPALAEPNVINQDQSFLPDDVAILSSDSSSMRLTIEMLPGGISRPMAPRAKVFNIAGFSIGNIMWSRSLSRSSFL